MARAVFLPVLAALFLSACTAPGVAARDSDAVLDRLLALPLEKLATAMSDASIWRGG